MTTEQESEQSRINQDDAEAAKWYRKAADQGIAEAQYSLGFLYYIGRGVPQNYTEAVHWWREAVNRGDVDAPYMLGLAYVTGKGVKQDFVQSYFWFSLAASRESENQYKKASDARDRTASKLTPDELKEAQRIAREWEKSHPRK